MKVVVNRCYGGFGLSPLAKKRYAELKGKELYFFGHDFKTGAYTPLTVEEAHKALVAHAYTVPNPQDYRLNERDEDGLYNSANARAESISCDASDADRTDPDLVRVVEELGEAANTRFSKLEVVEIPDDVEYRIDEYDGSETIAEGRTW